MNIHTQIENNLEWANERAIDGPCRDFPDCSCGTCHLHHKEIGEHNYFCEQCDKEKCPDCDGKGYKENPGGRSDCERCEGSGWTD